MKHNAIAYLRLIAVAGTLASLAGCQTNHTGQAAHCECFPGCYETPPCFGYHSTCWRPWPEECPNCPPYTLPAMPTEQVLPGPPLPGGPTPVGPMPPMPMPDNAPPQPMLQPATPPATPMPAAPPTNDSAAAASGEEPLAADDGVLPRRWVEGGFVSQPRYR